MYYFSASMCAESRRQTPFESASAVKYLRLRTALRSKPAYRTPCSSKLSAQRGMNLLASPTLCGPRRCSGNGGVSAALTVGTSPDLSRSHARRARGQTARLSAPFLCGLGAPGSHDQAARVVSLGQDRSVGRNRCFCGSLGPLSLWPKRFCSPGRLGSRENGTAGLLGAPRPRGCHGSQRYHRSQSACVKRALAQLVERA